MNQNYIAVLGKIILAAASTTAIAFPISGAFASEGFAVAGDETVENMQLQRLLLADNDNDDDDEKKIRLMLPETVKSAVFKNISERTQVKYSALRLLRAEKTTWVDGCLGLKGNCSKALVPGYIVVVASDSQMWVYRTDKSGKIAKLDEESTQTYSAMMMKRQTVMSRVNRRETMQVRRSQVLSANTSSTQAMTNNTVAARRTKVTASQTAIKSKSGIAIAIYQPAGNLSEVITRVSVKTKGGKKGFYKERFLGDYKYKIKQKQKAKFVKGLKAGDRMVVRLYDTQNRFLGYSEFEYLSANTVVNLILSSNPTQSQIVRTVYGIDSDFDGQIDTSSKTYSYFTQVSNERVSFLNSSNNINVSQFQVQGISTATTSMYPATFTQGEYAVVSRSMSVFSSDSAAALKAAPGSLVGITEVSDNDSMFDVSQQMMAYREVGVSRNIQVKFSDVSTSHWAKDFIAELAALEIIEGFPDGTFRPDEQVNRAQFAAMINQAFEKVKTRKAIKFTDVSNRYWAANAISKAYEMGFLGASGSQFNPTKALSRLEVLLAFARGLNYNVSGSTENILTAYTDATMIRSDVRSAIAALTQKGVVVNYPDVASLNPEKVATRAEVSALLYKALVSTGEVADISSQYAVGQSQEAAELEQVAEMEESGNVNVSRNKKPKQNCNQGIGNGAEGCDPGNSRPHGGSNDEGGRTPGGK